jgi:hypothetical protein
MKAFSSGGAPQLYDEAEILESLGKFIDEGQRLENNIGPNRPVEKEKIAGWMQRTADFLRPLGYSYVVRFMSDAGLETALSVNGIAHGSEQHSYWISVRNRLTRSHEFSAEYSGQIPKSRVADF